MEQVEFATLSRGRGFNTQRLMEPLSYLPPVEYEGRFLRTHSSDLG